MSTITGFSSDYANNMYRTVKNTQNSPNKDGLKWVRTMLGGRDTYYAGYYGFGGEQKSYYVNNKGYTEESVSKFELIA